MLDAVRIVSIRRADYWLVEVRGVGGAALPAPTFQSAGRIIGWLKRRQSREICSLLSEFQSAGRIIGWLKTDDFIRSKYGAKFQSAGRIIGWLKAWRRGDAVSIRRANVKVPYYYNTFLHWNALRRYTSDSQAFAPCFAARSFEKQRDP